MTSPPLQLIQPSRAAATDVPERGWLGELWHYRELMYFLAWRDIKVRYKQAVFGAAWAVLQPLATMIVFTLFFSRLAGLSAETVPYPVSTFAALVLWMYCNSVIGQGGQSLVSNSNLITKVYFPRILLPVSNALSMVPDLLVGLAFLAVLLGYYGVAPAWTVLLTPLYFVLTFVLCVGVSMLLSAMNVRFRDVKYVIPLMLQLWMFTTPVIYPLSYVPEKYHALMALNPMTGIVEGFRACLFGDRPFDPAVTAISVTVTLAVFAVGLVYFRKTERVFADVI